MPKKLEDCVKQVKQQGMPEDSAWPICIDSTGLEPHQKSESYDDHPDAKWNVGGQTRHSRPIYHDPGHPSDLETGAGYSAEDHLDAYHYHMKEGGPTHVSHAKTHRDKAYTLLGSKDEDDESYSTATVEKYMTPESRAASGMGLSQEQILSNQVKKNLSGGGDIGSLQADTMFGSGIGDTFMKGEEDPDDKMVNVSWGENVEKSGGEHDTYISTYRRGNEVGDLQTHLMAQKDEQASSLLNHIKMHL